MKELLLLHATIVEDHKPNNSSDILSKRANFDISNEELLRKQNITVRLPLAVDNGMIIIRVIKVDIETERDTLLCHANVLLSHM